MSSGTTSLTIFSEEQKFNGENLLQWNITMVQLLGSKGLNGYVDGKIVKPTSPTVTTTTPDPSTPIYSLIQATTSGHFVTNLPGDISHLTAQTLPDLV